MNLWCLHLLFPESLCILMVIDMELNVTEQGGHKLLILHTASRRAKESFSFDILLFVEELDLQCNNLPDDFSLIIKARVQPAIALKEVPEKFENIKKR